MKLKIIAGGVTALLASAALVVSAPIAASAHTPTASATCEAVTVDAVYYETKPGTPAVTEDRIIKEAWTETIVDVPAQPAVEPTLWLFKHKNGHKERWEAFDWNAAEHEGGNDEGGGNGKGWYRTDVNNGKAAVEAQTHTVDHPAEYGPVEVTPAVPADDTPNTVVVTVNGETKVSEEFGTSFHKVVPFANKYVANDWSVTITAWNDPTGSKGWTKTISGKSTPCDVPVVGPNHNATGEAFCGGATITLYNQQGEYEQAQTASFVAYIDGVPTYTYAVAGGESEVVKFWFPEDSGNHQIILRTGAAQGDEFVYSQDVPDTDCIAPQPEPEVTVVQTTPEIDCTAKVGDELPTTSTVTTTPYVLSEGQWVLGEPEVTVEDSVYVVTAEDVEALNCPVVTPPTEEKPKPAVRAAAVSDDTLAQTGSALEVGGWIGGALILLIGGAATMVLAALRRKSAAE